MWAAHANMQTAKQSPWGVAQLVEARLVTQCTRRSQQQHAEHAAQVSLCSTWLYAQPSDRSQDAQPVSETCREGRTEKALS